MEPIRFRRGFTLIELLVVLSIITIITTVVITSQSAFNKTLILANAAYDVALTLRFAETYGLGSRAYGTTVNAGYGLHFQAGTLGSFIFFSDLSPSASCDTPNCKAGDHAYTNGADALVQTYTFGNGITISKFCALTGSWECSSGTPTTISSLDIVFERPNPDAFMSKNGSYAPFPVTAACITLTSPQGGERFVSVAASGRITANASSCP